MRQDISRTAVETHRWRIFRYVKLVDKDVIEIRGGYAYSLWYRFSVFATVLVGDMLLGVRLIYFEF